MTRLRRIEAEPLSDQRWARIERSLFSRLEQEAAARVDRVPPGARSRVPAWLVAAAVLVSAALVALVVVRSVAEPPPVSVPSRIATGAQGSHLSLSGLSVDVEPHSTVVVGPETRQGLLIVVDRGGVVCDVAPRPSDAPLVVQAGAARVRVVGTRFSVKRLGEAAHVVVQEGVVEVSSGGQRFRVAAGEEWPPRASRGQAPETAPVIPPPLASDAVARGDAAPPRRAPLGSRSKATPARSPVTEVPVERAPSSQEIFEQAAALERRHPAQASQLYAKLESGGDSWAQNALYAHARLEATRGNRAAARRLLERYLERFPRGSNAEDARAVLERLR